MKWKPLRIMILFICLSLSLDSETNIFNVKKDLFSFSDYLELVNNVKQSYLYRNQFNESNGYVYSAFFACQFLDNKLFLMPETYFDSHQIEFLKIKKVYKLLPNDPFVIVLFDKNLQNTTDRNQYLEIKNWYSKKRREVMDALWNGKFNLEDYKRVLSFIEENLDWYILQQSKEITMSDLHFTAAMGFMYSLDGNSKIYKKRKFEVQIEVNEHQIAGVGMILRLGPNQEVIVENPLEASPAMKAGLLSGDIIVKINDIDVRDMEFEEVIRHQKGKPGSIVQFEIKRGRNRKSIPILVKREILSFDTVKGEFIRFDPDLALIRVFRWDDQNISVAKEINSEYVRLSKLAKDQNKKLKGLLLDFRYLRGGTMDSIAETINLFMKKGLLFSIQNGKGEVTERYAKANEPIELPVAILVDRYTSSGGEVIAGSLQFHKRAIVIGERTSGNAALVSTFHFSNNENYGMEILDSLYFLPSKKSFQEKGIIPDIQFTSEFDGGNLFFKKENYDLNHFPFVEEAENKNSQFPIGEIQSWVKENGKANVEIERRKNDPIRPDVFLFHAVDAFNGYLQTHTSGKSNGEIK